MSSFVWAFCGTTFTFLMTAAGSALVFLIRGRIGEKAQRLCLGCAGGVMSAAAVFSLLLPAMEQLGSEGRNASLTVTLGFLLGAGMVAALDAALRRMERIRQAGDAVRKRILLFCAVTLHNIPEGMAVGLAFALASGGDCAALAGAWVLALGIGAQNFPEGAALSLPLRQGGMSRKRSFFLGAASGLAEPLSAVIVVFLAGLLAPAMPFLMAFSAGAMMLVTFSEMFPLSTGQQDGAAAAVTGYVLMMAMDLMLS